jgi:hypothetical protein
LKLLGGVWLVAVAVMSSAQLADGSRQQRLLHSLSGGRVGLLVQSWQQPCRTLLLGYKARFSECTH